MKENFSPKSTGLAVAAILLGFIHSNAKDIEISIEKTPEIESKEMRILGQVFSQIGNGRIGDDYVGTSRRVNSDLGFGLRIGTGISWKHFMLALNAEYLSRNLDISETPVVAIPQPYEKVNFDYHYLKLQPEFILKMNVSEKAEIGAIAGIGLRTKINDDKSESGLDKSVSMGFYGQFNGVNIRISEEFFYQNLYYSESSNTAIGIGYSHSFQLN